MEFLFFFVFLIEESDREHLQKEEIIDHILYCTNASCEVLLP